MTELDEPTYALPRIVPKYLPILADDFGRKEERVLSDLLRAATVEVETGTDYDSWDGGMTGHTVHLSVSGDLYGRIDLDHLGDLEERTREALRKVARADGEYIARVMIELSDEDPFGAPTPSNPRARDADRWEGHPDFLRLFISHKWEDRALATLLQIAGLGVGISCFVAHKDIRPTTQWESEIMRALSSMDALLALITEDFPNSDWTDQEVGIALGRGVPVVPVRLGRDPYGFIGKYQGLSGVGVTPPELSRAILLALLNDNPDTRPGVLRALVARFETAETFPQANGAMKILRDVTALPVDLVDRIEAAPGNNSLVARAYGVTPYLPGLVARLREAGGPPAASAR